MCSGFQRTPRARCAGLPFENLQSFGGQFVRQEGDAGGISTGVGKTCRKNNLHRIDADGVNDRYGLGRLAGERSYVAAERKKHVGIQAHQVRG